MFFWSVVLALFVLTIFLHIFSFWHKKRSAKKILKQQKALFSGEMEYAEVDPEDFNWLDGEFYEDFAARMREKGFTLAGNVECITATKQFPLMRTYIRHLIGGGGTINGSAYHVKVRGWMNIFVLFRLLKKHIKTYEFGTEFEDGTFLGTANTKGLLPTSNYPGLVTLQLPPETSPEELLTAHQEALKKLIGEKDIQPKKLISLNDILASENRAHKIKSKYKKETGYVTREQFEEIAGGSLSEEQIKLVAEFEKNVEEDKKLEPQNEA